MFRKLLPVLLMLAISFSTLIVVAQETPELIPYTDAISSFEILVPDGWSELAPGAFARQQLPNDVTTFVVQAAPATSADDLLTALLPNLLLDAPPEPTGTASYDGLDWTLYNVEVSTAGIVIEVIMALTDTDESAYLVLLQASPEDATNLRDGVFEPALASFMLTTNADDGTGDGTDDALYTDPQGLFTVPIPTNWTVEESVAEDGVDYARFAAPEDSVLAYFMATPAQDDLFAALQTGWERVIPDFDLTYQERDVLDLTDPALTEGFDRVLFITYDTRDSVDDRIVQGLLFVLEDMHYLLMFDTTLAAAQQRSAQINILNSGFTVLSLVEDDLNASDAMTIDEAMIADLEAYIMRALEEYNTPGVQVAIVQDGRVVYRNALGVADNRTDAPLATDTLMMIGSITKTFTTAFMAQLAGEGVLDFDAPAIDYMPEFRFANDTLTETISVSNLVCACTGVPRRDLEFILNSDELSASDVVESLATFQLFTEIGEAFQYSNQMVATGGYVAAMAAGASYETLEADFSELLRAGLLDPLGMSRTTLSIDDVIADGNYSTSHSFNIDEMVQALPIESEMGVAIVGPAGAIWSNVEEMSAYLQMVMAGGVLEDGTRLIDQTQLQRLWEPQIDISANAQYGLGWFISEYKGIREISHGGTTFGFQAEMAFLPDANVGIIVLSNRNGSPVPALVKAVFYELVFGVEPEADAQYAASVALGSDAEDEARANFIDTDSAFAESVSGVYTNDVLGGLAVTWDADAGVLIADFGEFATSLQSYADPDDPDTPTFLLAEPPLAGVTMTIEDGAFVLQNVADTYRFEPAE